MFHTCIFQQYWSDIIGINLRLLEKSLMRLSTLLKVLSCLRILLVTITFELRRHFDKYYLKFTNSITIELRRHFDKYHLKFTLPLLSSWGDILSNTIWNLHYHHTLLAPLQSASKRRTSWSQINVASIRGKKAWFFVNI